MMNPREELNQNLTNFLSHVWFGTAWIFGYHVSGNPWTTAAWHLTVFASIWEVIGLQKLISPKAKASWLGWASYLVGGGLAIAVIKLFGRS